MKRIGFDLGSSSIGWALRENNEISRYGVITFKAGMNKGQGQGGYTSPTRDRRIARSKRRLIQARKYRKWALIQVLLNGFAPLNKTELESWSKYKKGGVRIFPENANFMKWLSCDFGYEGGIKYTNPYELRVKALDEKLSNHEFGRALYHLVQRRGYKNIGESDVEEVDVDAAKKDTETKTQIEKRDKSGFQKALQNNRTIAEALKKEFLDKDERARNQYPYRKEYREELELICKGQGYDVAKNEKGDYDDEFVQKLWNAIIWQRPLRSQKGNIGKCTLEPTKPRCPASHPIFEIFRTWSFINTIKYFNDDAEKQNLSSEYRKLLFDFFLKKDKNFKFEDIRKYLDKQFGSKKKYNYPIDKKTGKYDTSVPGMPVCKGLITVIGEKAKDAIHNIHHYNIGNAPKLSYGYSLYDLWHILFSFDEKTAKEKKFLETFAIEKLKIENEKDKNGKSSNSFAKLKGAITQGNSDLSLKAICKIIPFLQDGFLYNESVVLAKIPELLGNNWNQEKEKVEEIIKDANEIYKLQKNIVGIANNIIDRYKGLDPHEVFAYKDYNYTLDKADLNDIERACIGYFGEESWEFRLDNEDILAEVRKQYQDFFCDAKRAYRKTPLLTDIFKTKLKEIGIEINGEFYHHSNRKNIYGEPVIDKKTGIEILPEPRIDSIKNPMFNKSMSILRKITNELIKDEIIDKDTEVVVELARGKLNDNNKRTAIERYQNERRNKRDKYRTFLSEFNEKENKSINVDESIAKFELWTEQIFEEMENEKGKKINKNTSILQEKDALKRYELWVEQRGQCMYTGKMISISQLFSNEIDIEHTIPRSVLPDNTLANQTVCYSWYNRDKKRNQLPKHCLNYSQDKDGWGTKIEPRLDSWIQKRDSYKKLYEDRLNTKGNEDDLTKNKRIQDKHYFKMHYNYWKDKVQRFEANEVKDSWARRQLVDTQMVSKYAREFLKTYFKKVAVQKGIVTADFRKIYSFQEQDEIKSRNRHTHHAIDAAILTLIPTNSSHRDKILKKAYETEENEKRQYTTLPFSGFNSQKLINDIENKTLIVNYENDTILKRTSKIVRKRGRIQFVKNKEGEFILDKNGEKIIKIAQGDTVRSTLFKDTFVAKIKDVERHEDGQPKRENGYWKYKEGKDEFIFTVRKPIADVLNKTENIIDPVIREIVRKQKENSIDPQGKKIRHVRIKTSAGQKVKKRINYRSAHDYKNNYYAAAGSIPYAIMLQKTKDSKVERKLIPVASFEIAKYFKKNSKFDVVGFVAENYKEYNNWSDKKILKIGQKVIVFNNDDEYKNKYSLDFLKNRLYKITQFGTSDNNIYLKYHLEAQADTDIDKFVKIEKDLFLREYEKKYDLPAVKEDETIEDKKERKDDYEDKRYSFFKLTDFRFKRLIEVIGKDEFSKIKNELKKFKKQSAKIELDGKTPLLKMESKNWNFFYEGEDFEISMLGEITWVINR